MRYLVLAAVTAALVFPVAAFAGCDFNATTLSFAGTPQAQATCLLRHVKPGGSLEAQDLPPNLLARLATPFSPTAAQTNAALANLPDNVRETVRSGLTSPLSKTPSGESALYFVIHDTSAPNYLTESFPDDLQASKSVNNIQRYLITDAVAHAFVNRRGEVGIGHDFSVPWRATKLESKIVGTASRGRFVHVELLQPRRSDPARKKGNDHIAPDPGFSDAQYRCLASLYVVASARAGQWLIPAFHAAIDEGVPEGHDDPQHFDITRLDQAISDILSAS